MEWTNNNNFDGINVVAIRDTNSVLGVDGWQVCIKQANHKSGFGRTQLPFGAQDVEAEFKDCLVFFEDHSHHGICLQHRGTRRAFSREEADDLIEKVRDWINEFAGKKRIRQIRDALNKCKNPKRIEQVAQVLGV